MESADGIAVSLIDIPGPAWWTNALNRIDDYEQGEAPCHTGDRHPGGDRLLKPVAHETRADDPRIFSGEGEALGRRLVTKETSQAALPPTFGIFQGEVQDVALHGVGLPQKSSPLATARPS